MHMHGCLRPGEVKKWSVLVFGQERQVELSRFFSVSEILHLPPTLSGPIKTL